MAALKLDMTIPLGGAGHIHLAIDITDIDQLTPAQRTGMADTVAEFCAFAGATLAPAGIIRADGELRAPPATVYDPNTDVLNGVTGSRRNNS